MSEQPIWNFHCAADRLENGSYRVRVVSASGKRFERTGYHPLWELIRILGKDAKESEAGK